MSVPFDTHTALVIADFCERLAAFCEDKGTDDDKRRAEAFWVVRNYIHDELHTDGEDNEQVED